MNRSEVSRLICAATIALVGALGSARPSMAADPAAVYVYDAGLACSFKLQIELYGTGTATHFKEFTDKDGVVERWLFNGKGPDSRYMNLETGKALFLKGNGSVLDYRFNADGSTTVTTQGHVVSIQFPTDVPAGPSTTLVVGHTEFTVSTDGVWTLLKQSGKTTDICAALAP